MKATTYQNGQITQNHKVLKQARSNGHNILTTFAVTCCDHARSNGHNNLSTFQEQKKCCDDVETKFK